MFGLGRKWTSATTFRVDDSDDDNGWWLPTKRGILWDISSLPRHLLRFLFVEPKYPGAGWLVSPICIFGTWLSAQYYDRNNFDVWCMIISAIMIEKILIIGTIMIDKILTYDYRRSIANISAGDNFSSRESWISEVAGSRCNYHLVRFPNPYLVVYNTVGEPD